MFHKINAHSYSLFYYSTIQTIYPLAMDCGPHFENLWFRHLSNWTPVGLKVPVLQHQENNKCMTSNMYVYVLKISPSEEYLDEKLCAVLEFCFGTKTLFFLSHCWGSLQKPEIKMSLSVKLITCLYSLMVDLHHSDTFSACFILPCSWQHERHKLTQTHELCVSYSTCVISVHADTHSSAVICRENIPDITLLLTENKNHILTTRSTRAKSKLLKPDENS